MIPPYDRTAEAAMQGQMPGSFDEQINVHKPPHVSEPPASVSPDSSRPAPPNKHVALFAQYMPQQNFSSGAELLTYLESTEGPKNHNLLQLLGKLICSHSERKLFNDGRVSAAEITQETFLAIWGLKKSIAFPAGGLPYIFGIANHKRSDAIHHQARQPSVSWESLSPSEHDWIEDRTSNPAAEAALLDRVAARDIVNRLSGDTSTHSFSDMEIALIDYMAFGWPLDEKGRRLSCDELAKPFNRTGSAMRTVLTRLRRKLIKQLQASSGATGIVGQAGTTNEPQQRL